MDGFEKRRNDKKDSIMQAAMELFIQYGFERVTVTEIAQKARVSKVSIYNFFESKDNLRRIIVKGMMDSSLEKTTEIIASDAAFADKIKSYLACRTIYSDRRTYQFFFDAVGSDPVLRQSLEDFSATNKSLVLMLIKEGKKTGFIAPNVSNEALEIYIDIFQSYVLRLGNEAFNRFEVTPTLASEINQLFLDGLLRQEAGQ
ncbi:MAG: TetR/AcrR family transcriptional regulator [Clostridiales bacterium]|jgi:AcrR family transcriptional regulator|nr:TetR/AcrR family transcriptional regulator [Clostridiales bacterium]